MASNLDPLDWHQHRGTWKLCVSLQMFQIPSVFCQQYPLQFLFRQKFGFLVFYLTVIRLNLIKNAQPIFHYSFSIFLRSPAKPLLKAFWWRFHYLYLAGILGNRPFRQSCSRAHFSKILRSRQRNFSWCCFSCYFSIFSWKNQYFCPLLINSAFLQ